MQTKEFFLEVGSKTLTAEFSDLAEQANGSVILRYGNTAVLATAVMSSETREGLGYFPLTVDYEEKFYAAGKILGSRFMRREGRPSDEAVLSGRAVDRTIRPLFDHRIRNDVQVIVTILSIDEDDPDILAINAASLALAVSDIPWSGPVSAVRLGQQGEQGDFVVNPSYTFRDSNDTTLELLACGRDRTINMVEVAAREVREENIADALICASKEIEEIQAFQEKIVRQIGKKKREIETEEISDTLVSLFKKEIEPKLDDAVFGQRAGKEDIRTLKQTWLALATETFPEEGVVLADDYFEKSVDTLIHKEALENNRRADGRGMDEIRPLYAQAGNTARMVHGSGIFYRGGTHVFAALTLGGPDDSLLINSMEAQETRKHFMLHYNFPPFSTGETGRIGGANRRMIGHGALAEKALIPVIPKKEDFPYTIRIVSECMASNGSTSMASVCASALALMDGGVPITRPVAGIALGLMMSPHKGTDRTPEVYKILTDIQGPEDYHGDMDLKVAGTTIGVTALQMDVKVNGIPIPILKEALDAGRVARAAILKTMTSAIAKPRKNISEHAPRVEFLTIKKDQIGLVIGAGGKTINDIKNTTGVEEITIEPEGVVYVIGRGDSTKKAVAIIEELTHEYIPGERFMGEVTRVTNFGVFVKLGRGTEGLVHISEIAPFRVEKIEDYLKVGEQVPVVIKEIDDKGRINLSIKSADPKFAEEKRNKNKKGGA